MSIVFSLCLSRCLLRTRFARPLDSIRAIIIETIRSQRAQHPRPCSAIKELDSNLLPCAVSCWRRLHLGSSGAVSALIFRHHLSSSSSCSCCSLLLLLLLVRPLARSPCWPLATQQPARLGSGPNWRFRGCWQLVSCVQFFSAPSRCVSIIIWRAHSA